MRQQVAIQPEPVRERSTARQSVVSIAGQLPAAGTTLCSGSPSLITPCSPLGVLLILHRAPTHAPASREEDEHDNDDQNYRHEELQQQHPLHPNI
jgi:hypothetical protein